MFVYDPSNNPLNTIEWAFPVAECMHILGFAVSIGTIAIIDLRLLGLSLSKVSPAQLVKDTTPWTLIGLAAVLISGPALFSTDPYMYVYNPSFQFKMAAFLLGLIFNYTIHYKVAKSGAPSLLAKLVGAVSLAIWISVVAGGIFIGFV
jgi:hypothetical protein